MRDCCVADGLGPDSRIYLSIGGSLLFPLGGLYLLDYEEEPPLAPGSLAGGGGTTFSFC